jgi:hypothetical protein
MVRKLTAIGLVALLVSAVVVGPAAALGGQQAASLHDARLTAGNDSEMNTSTATITVTGSGAVEAQPDRALVSVSVTATGENASVAAQRLAANVSQLRAALTESNLTDSVQTTSYRVGERRIGDRGETTTVARQSFEIGVPNTSDVGAVIDLAVDAGATEIGGVEFTLSEERREELRRTAIERAVDDAREQAEAVAASTELRITGIESVSVGGGGFVGVRLETANADTVVEPSPVTVSVSVQITYDATEE